MRLLELQPRWIHPNVFIFLCPCCKKWLISCKNVVMSSEAQWQLLERVGGWRGDHLILTKPLCAWSVTGDFTNLTVRPSIDASAAGHWHGFITNGEVT